MQKNIVILGGGVTGLQAAYDLMQKGYKVTLIEKAKEVGGAAASIQIPENRKVPAGYHQIVGSDKYLIKTLEKLDLLESVKWKKTRITAYIDGAFLNLASVIDILKLQRLSFVSKIQYFLFGARCMITHDWSSWDKKSVTELIRSWANNQILSEIFKPLIDIKFGFSTDEANAAWLGSRLSHREGNIPFGYIPHTSWTDEMCKKFVSYIIKNGGTIHTDTAVQTVIVDKKKIITSVTTDTNKTIKADVIISTLPPPIVTKLLKDTDIDISSLSKIQYISCYSLIAGLPVVPFKEYWTIALHPRKIFGGCFTLSHLNETLITQKDKAVINLFTNVPFNTHPWDKDTYIKKAMEDLSKMSNKKIKPNWVRLSYISTVSPVFDTRYQNPPSRIGKNIFLAGIYRTYPRLSSTGEAMADGHSIAQEVLAYLQKNH